MLRSRWGVLPARGVSAPWHTKVSRETRRTAQGVNHELSREAGAVVKWGRPWIGCGSRRGEAGAVRSGPVMAFMRMSHPDETRHPLRPLAAQGRHGAAFGGGGKPGL